MDCSERDLVQGDVYPLNSIQSCVLKQSARVNLKHVGGGRQSGNFESNARRNKSEFLRAENCLTGENLNILKYFFVSA